MRELAAALLLIACAPLGLFGQQTPPDPTEASRPFVSIFTHADYARRPAEAKLVAMVQTGDLFNFVRGSRFKHYTDDDPIYRGRLASMFPESTFPVITVQRPDGGYWYKASGGRIPSAADAMLEEIKFYTALDPAPDSSAKTQILPAADCPDCPDGYCPDPYSYPPAANPNALPDMAELFGGRTPIRDSLANMATVAFFFIAACFLLFLLCVAAIILFFVRPRR